MSVANFLEAHAGIAGSSGDEGPIQDAVADNLSNLLEASYIFVGLAFMYAIRGLGSPVTARNGNLSGIMGMFIAICFVCLEKQFLMANAWKALAVMAVSLVIGIIIASRAEMIIMPQMVAGFHCMVGLAAVLVAIARYVAVDVELEGAHMVETAIGIFFGALTFTGSVVAAGKLHGVISSLPLSIPGKHYWNALMILACVGCCVGLCIFEQLSTSGQICLYVLTGISGLIGWHLVMSIGGADMPVVVSMLNSYSGWTTVAAGFMLDNDLLIIAGSIIGSSGAILSYIMCAAMNRSFISVIAGGFGAAEGTTVEVTGTAVTTDSDEVAKELLEAKSVIIVPGYGMAVARCQADVGAMVDVLRKSGVKVRFGIHEVAGRLPGHMNVLLAEANVPYDIVVERPHLVQDMEKTDVTLVIGANDIVNPLALEDCESAIKGMPVLEVWRAKRCVVMKRSLATGYAGVDNPLFYKDNCRMLLGSANKTIAELLTKIRASAKTEGNVVATEKTSLLKDVQQVMPVQKVYPTPVKTVGVITEASDVETRVAISPLTVPLFRDMAFQVLVQKGAGKAAHYPDSLYEAEGANMAATRKDVFAKSDVIVKIADWTVQDLEFARPGQIVVGYFWPSQAQKKELMDALCAKKVTAVAMDCVPRITVAQKCDTLSSMANMAGYKAVVDAFFRLPRFSKPLITSAGSVPPAKVFVIGAGVAGLSAIGTARGLGAMVRAHDTRAAVKEQVESMGAEMVEVKYEEAGEGAGGYAKQMSDGYQQAQKELYKKICAESDVVVTTANIPGIKAPILVTAEMIRSMRPGSIIIDLAAPNGGNTELTKSGEVYTEPQSGVVLVGISNMAATMPAQASDLYASNLKHYFNHFGGATKLDNIMAKPSEDTLGVIEPTVITRDGNFLWTKPAPPPPAPAPKQTQTAAPVAKKEEAQEEASFGPFAFIAVMLAGLVVISVVGLEIKDTATIYHIFAFLMSVIIGYFLVWGVDPALHTPLMAVTNAISGIIVTGGLLQINGPITSASVILALLAIFFSSINIFGGFLLTKKMLDFFKK